MTIYDILDEAGEVAGQAPGATPYDALLAFRNDALTGHGNVLTAAEAAELLGRNAEPCLYVEGAGGADVFTAAESKMDDCVFCELIARGGPFVMQDAGCVVVTDREPAAETHLLVIPREHVATFREIEFLGFRERATMLGFIAEVARKLGLTDYRLVVNVGAGGGQSVFHLHWHLLAGESTPRARALVDSERWKSDPQILGALGATA